MTRPLDIVLKTYEGIVGPKSHLLLTARANLAALRKDADIFSMVKDEIKLLRRTIARYAAGEQDTPWEVVRGQLAMFQEFLLRVDTGMLGEPTDSEVVTERAMGICWDLVNWADSPSEKSGGNPPAASVSALTAIVAVARVVIHDEAQLGAARAAATHEQPAAGQSALVLDETTKFTQEDFEKTRHLVTKHSEDKIKGGP